MSNNSDGRWDWIYGYRGKQVVGPVLARLIGLIVLGAGSLLAYVFVWAAGKFFAHRSFNEAGPAFVLIGGSGLFALIFLVIAIRLLIFGGDSGKSALPTKAWVFIGAAFMLVGGLTAFALINSDQLYFALVAAFVFAMLAVGCFVAAQTTVDVKAATAQGMDWAKVDITWTGIRDWGIRKRTTILISLALSLLVWGIAVWMWRISGGSGIPDGFTRIDYTSYPTYELWQKGPMLMATRASHVIDHLLLIFMSYMIAFFAVDFFILPYLRNQHAKRSTVHHPAQAAARFGAMDIVMPCLLIAFLGYWAYYVALPAFRVVAYPQVYTFDPGKDAMYYNGKPACRISSIREFAGYYERRGRYRYGEWGVAMTDGSYYRLDSGFLVGQDVQALASYLNGYLKKQSE